MFTVEAIEQDEDLAKLVAGCSLIVGLHPDEATDAIVDLALRFNKPFAVVPCCVFTRLFPERRTKIGDPVSRYEDLLDYLSNKAPDSIIMTTLPFRGRRRCLYSLES